MKHTFQCHSSAANFRYACRIQGCAQTFKTYSAISSHLLRKHPGCEFSQIAPDTPRPHDTEDQCNSSEDAGSGNDELVPVNINSEESTCMTENFLLKKATALLLLNLKERHHLTQSAIDFSIGQITQMVFHLTDNIKMAVKRKLEEVDIDDCLDSESE